jgi:signal transduction histidine kinase
MDECGGPQRPGPRADLECQSLVAEQARELAHRLRSPLGAIELVCESLLLDQPDAEVAERLQVALTATAKLKSVLNDTLGAQVPRWPVSRPLDLIAVCTRLAAAEGIEFERSAPWEELDAADGPVWIAAAASDCELALWQALTLARLGSGKGQVRLSLVETAKEVEVSFTPKKPLGSLDRHLDVELPAQGLAPLRLKRLRRFAADQGGRLEVEPSRLLLRLRLVAPDFHSPNPTQPN